MDESEVTLVAAVIAAVAAIVGPIVSIVNSRLVKRREELRTRERTAAQGALEVIAKLLLLEPDPREGIEMAEIREDVRRDQARKRGLPLPKPLPKPALPDKSQVKDWERRRDDLLIALDLHVSNFSNNDLRNRLDAAYEILSYRFALWWTIHAPESVLRRVACYHARACIRSFYRGDRTLPETPDRFTQAVDALNDWKAEQDVMAEFAKQERLERQMAEDQEFLRELAADEITGDDSSTPSP
ncbi:hypothetical protein [Nonomuraea sp. NEAU-A123]|uniref:hypothetical protein n=1 Tax=Nonomuraea sp. NEAU-A123 TaxID=2839649 RepID=UPI001BE42C54|nr:hypothetical protein [Nonomuraea sp. NEAU-A123]MBT2234413.1 hypothetical protein [Nonomuraea sp. NEAU-A123]